MDDDISGLVFRWSTSEDAVPIERLLEPTIVNGLSKLYSSHQIHHQIETCISSITVLSGDNVEGFASFDDHPHNIELPIKEYSNYWEGIVADTFLTNNTQRPFITLWLTYFLLKAKYKEE